MGNNFITSDMITFKTVWITGIKLVTMSRIIGNMRAITFVIIGTISFIKLTIIGNILATN